MSDKVALCERSRRRCNKKENSISLNEVKKSKPPSMINNKDTEYLEYCPDYKIKEVEIKDRIYPIYQISKPEKEKIEGYKTKEYEKNKKNKKSKKEPKDQYTKKEKKFIIHL